MNTDVHMGLQTVGSTFGTRQTLRERLIERKTSAKEHLQSIEQALEFLDANPSFEVFHNLVGKAGF